jgi:hypothetical protein
VEQAEACLNYFSNKLKHVPHLRVILMRVLFLLGLICVAVSADTLKLRDGRVLSGQFLGATRSEIWFQRDVPGEVLGKEAFPVMQVESLIFGPNAQTGSAYFKNPLMLENCALSSSFSGSSSASNRRAAAPKRSCTSGRSSRL